MTRDPQAKQTSTEESVALTKPSSFEHDNNYYLKQQQEELLNMASQALHSSNQSRSSGNSSRSSPLLMEMIMDPTPSTLLSHSQSSAGGRVSHHETYHSSNKSSNANHDILIDLLLEEEENQEPLDLIHLNEDLSNDNEEEIEGVAEDEISLGPPPPPEEDDDDQDENEDYEENDADGLGAFDSYYGFDSITPQPHQSQLQRQGQKHEYYDDYQDEDENDDEQPFTYPMTHNPLSNNSPRVVRQGEGIDSRYLSHEHGTAVVVNFHNRTTTAADDDGQSYSEDDYQDYDCNYVEHYSSGNEEPQREGSMGWVSHTHSHHNTNSNNTHNNTHNNSYNYSNSNTKFKGITTKSSVSGSRRQKRQQVYDEDIEIDEMDLSAADLL